MTDAQLGSKRLKPLSPSPSTSLKSLAIHLHAYASQQGFTLAPRFQVQKGRLFLCRRNRYPDHCLAHFQVVKVGREWSIEEYELEHTHDRIGGASMIIESEIAGGLVSLLKKRRLSGSVDRERRSVPLAGATDLITEKVDFQTTDQGKRMKRQLSDEKKFSTQSVSNATYWDFPTSEEELVIKAAAIISKVICFQLNLTQNPANPPPCFLDTGPSLRPSFSLSLERAFFSNRSTIPR